MNTKIKLYNSVQDDIGYVQLVDHMGSDKTIVNAARVSFGVEKESVNERDKKLIKYLIEHKHTSTLEHNIVTFKFCVPMFVRSQHMRHRTWSYNEISRRYTDKDLKFYQPSRFRTQHESNRQASNETDLTNPSIAPTFLDTYATANEAIGLWTEYSLDFFDKLIDKGVCREQARMILPQNLYTEYYGTVNLNNLLKFIDLRLHEGAQWEIQQVAKACLTIAHELWPVPVSHFKNKRFPENDSWKIRSTAT
jgi:thymidylate synthase (FAD)